ASVCSEVLVSGYGVADHDHFYSLPFNTRDFRTIHGSRPACGSSRLTSSLHKQKKAPGLRRGLLLIRQDSTYRLTWRLVPPPGPPALAPLPLETTLTHSASLPL